MNKNILFSMLTSIMLLCGGCASIVRDNSQTIPIRANVEGTDIKIVNEYGATVYQSKTPTVVNLKTSTSGYFSPAKYTLYASKPGYQTYITPINWHVSAWYLLGNLGFGGLIGWLIVDPLTGKMYYLDEEVNINMTPYGGQTQYNTYNQYNPY